MIVRKGTGVYRAVESHWEILPRRYRPGDTLVVWCHEHGAGGGVYYLGGDFQACRSICDQALPQASADLGGSADWGKSIDAIDDLWERMVSVYGVADDGLLLWAGSMGGLLAANYARANPTKVKGLALAIPANDLAYHHSGEDAATGKFAAEVEAAYGGLAAYEAALANFSPTLHNLGDYSGEVLLFASEDDPQAPTAGVYEYASALNAEVVSLGSVGHSFQGLDGNRLARWLRAHAA
jgi:pimeloyl-ACP methyl ester carboxylesterase